ncbi:MAG TPA: hypothetical protein VIM11_26435 [Tepidisphaeraceae bacterium]
MKYLGWTLLIAAGAAAPIAFAAGGGIPAEQADGNQPAGDLLGAPFESESAGISLRIPQGCQRLQSTNAGDDVGQFGDYKRKWELKITRITRNEPTSLGRTLDNFGKPIPGLLDQTVARLRKDLAGSTILRQDLTNIADPGLGDSKLMNNVVNNVGMIAVRYGVAGGHFLSQQAIIQATDRLFYLISLTNPVPEVIGPKIEPSDAERMAVRAFRQMIDSVRLLDTATIRREQEDRLIRTRYLLLQLKVRTRVHAALVPEQWLRVLRSGRDIGYSYITEQTAAGVPKPLKPDEVIAGKNDSQNVKPGEGTLIGIRSRSMTQPEINFDGAAKDADSTKPRGPVQVDNATWLYVAPDQALEDWSRITVVDDGAVKKDGQPAKRHLMEFGSSTVQVRTEMDTSLYPGTKLDPKQPPAVIREHHKLDVTTITDTGASEPLSQEVPVFYLPQASGHLLPRLVPLVKKNAKDVHSYMFATYVADTRQVMSRYVDVGAEGDFNFNGQVIHAVPITDRLGWRGSVTTHYVDRSGKYLGSENKDTHTVIVPTDAQTLTGIWRGANLTQPGVIQRPGAGVEPRKLLPTQADTAVNPPVQGK